MESLPSAIHWYCESVKDGDPHFEAASVEPASHLLANAELRRDHAAECLLLYSFDDAAEYQDQLSQAINFQLGRCDSCIEGYYKAKQKLLAKLRDDYDEENVLLMEKALNDKDLERIKRGLDHATSMLERLEPIKRNRAALAAVDQMALYEALCNDAILKDQDILSQSVQQPFKLVQTNKTFRVPRYVPATTAFLFDTDDYRRKWAVNTWSKQRANPSKDDFNFAIRDPLLRHLQFISENVLDEAVLQRTWHGIGLIVKKLDHDLVTHSLRAMEIDVFKLALEHLQYDVSSFRILVDTIQKLLELAPKDFWDSLGAISPTTFIEQIFNNKQYDRYMEQAALEDVGEPSALQDMLSWIKPFLSSLDTAHQVGVCRSLAFQLLDRLQAERFPRHVRAECYGRGLSTLAETLDNVNKDGATLGSTARIVASDILEMISDHIDSIARAISPSQGNAAEVQCSKLSHRILETTLAVECKSAKTDYEALKSSSTDIKDLPAGYAAHSSKVWDTIIRNMSPGNLELAKASLVGITNLTGLEKFKVNAAETRSSEKSEYNIKLGRLTHLVCQIMERISEFSPRDLDILYKSYGPATALISSLFAADADLYLAGVNLIKTISSESARREAIGHLLRTCLETTLGALSWEIRRIARTRSYSSCPRLLRTATDVLDALCDSQDGLLRTKSLASDGEAQALQHIWEYQWQGLKMIYEMTEVWARNKIDDSETLKEFCRDTMEFSDHLFDQYSIFASVLKSRKQIKVEDTSSAATESTERELLKPPATTMLALVKWLRLRDLFLVEIAVKLTIKLLGRLTEFGMLIDEDTADFLEQAATGGPQGRTNMTPQEKAELSQALEKNTGRSISISTDSDSHTPVDIKREDNQKGGDVKEMPQLKSSRLDMEAWRAKARDSPNRSTEPSSKDKLEVLPTRRAPPISDRKLFASTRTVKGASSGGPNAQSDADRALFREKREREKEAKKKRDADNLALVKRKAGAGSQALGEGSGLGDLGVIGKDHTPKGPSMMVSSDPESDTEEDLDEGLFGPKAKSMRTSEAVQEYQAGKAMQKPRGPVKKMKQVRSAKDMRARLAPDLSPLHKVILGWDIFHNGDFPPGSNRNDYSLVTSTFRTPQEYQATFEPLLVLEAWQSFLKSREEGNFKTFEIKVSSRMTVDAFVEMSTSMPMNEAKEQAIGEADIVLLSKGNSPAKDFRQPHCLARIWKISRKKGTMEVTYRVNVGNNLVSSMVPNSILYCARVASVTPLEREYGALLGLKYFDLCDEVTRARPSPILEYTEKQLDPLMRVYNINMAQAKAVRSAIDNDAFTLVQGPPGSGKTKTIVAIVGALLTRGSMEKGQAILRPQALDAQGPRNHASAAKKLLVCAPSNAAVDELVMRFKQGTKASSGNPQTLSVIRLGRSDAINVNVVDVTLEELVNAKLNISGVRRNGATEDLGKLINAHQTACADYNVLRDTIDALKAVGKPISPEQNRDLEVLKRKKQQLSNQIDQARDSVNTVARDAEIHRRRVQQEILDSADIICATLSGSGHEMFQGLNIEFETVIIDEAAQSIELSALIPLKYGCSKCILVGDPKQLPPTVLSREAARFQYEQSLFVRMQVNHPRDVHLLDVQYRMHPEISAFPSKAFYDARLVDGPHMANQRARPWHKNDVLGPYRFFDVKGFHQSAPKGHSLINHAEIDIAMKLYHRLTSDCKGYDFRGKIGIITPYKSQLRELRARFMGKYGDAILTTVEFNTTDAFQGRESEVIIFSCVRASINQGIGFLSDIRRMNVGITRAQSSLWVLGNSQSLMQGEFWSRLIDDAKARHRYSSGDLSALLQRPVKIDDIRPSISSNGPVSSASNGAKKSDIDMPDAPNVNPKEGPVLPGGRNGLNDMLKCSACGSFDHRTLDCDNAEALEEAQGRCQRCKTVGHRKRDCTATRCVTCGLFGHPTERCRSDTALSMKERMLVSRLEIRHRTERASQPEIQRKKQLGDHDRPIPTVRSTAATYPMEMEQKKRKRETSPINSPTNVPPANKAHQSAENPKQPWRENDISQKRSTNVPSAVRGADAWPKNPRGHAIGVIPPPPGAPHLPQQPRHSGLPQAPNGNASTIIQTGKIALTPARAPPPQQNPVKPPKRKKPKEVDPFIKPKKRV